MGNMIILMIGICLLGMMAGYSLAMIKRDENPVGTLRVDRSDPDEAPYLFLELDDSTAVNRIVKSDTVSFRVRAENYIS